MIDRENDAFTPRHVLHAGQLDATKENLRRQRDHRRGDASNHAVVRSPRHAAKIHTTPPITMDTGTMRNARSSELTSESAPMSGGEGMSPIKCMIKTDNPRAVARSVGATAFTIAEFTGPVLMKISTSAITIAVR